MPAENASSQTTANDTPAKPEPWGRGKLCSGKLWVIEPDKECPICGAQAGDHCFKDPDYE